ncbi:TspO/MBR family protein [Streptomyces sp. NPDC051577]|uniref:TspO/MBR family protein n=1 Tax=Streptomyces sp. NPDC051577 TaxID=3155166 RepID=UPI003417B6A8
MGRVGGLRQTARRVRVMAHPTGDGQDSRGSRERHEPRAPHRAGAWSLLGLLAVCYAVAGLGAWASADAGSVYASLVRPGWAPPGWLFGPVWTVLYASIAVAAWLVLRRPAGSTRTAMTWWSVQLALNLAWTPLFFAAGQYGLAFLDICLLLTALALTLRSFTRHRKSAALMLLPYAAWVAFAAALNLSIWLSNT